MTMVQTPLRGSTEYADDRSATRFRPANWFLPILFVVLVAALAIGEPRFLSQLNLLNLSRNVSYLAIASLGQMTVMILGGMDLSIGVVVALSSVTTAIVMNHVMLWLPGHDRLAITIAIVSAMLVSAAVGLLNGLCVARAKASAFIVTLGTLSIVGGISYYVTAGIPIYGLPTTFTGGFGRGTLAGLPYSIFVAVGLVLLLTIVQRKSRTGRYLYAIGGNPDAARLSGISVERHIVFAYTACSVFAGIAGILITARIGAGQANLGTEYMLQSIAVAVVAGVSLRGGIGRAEMVLLSATFITVFANAMNLIRIDSKIQTIVFGVVLLGAVFLDRRKVLRQQS